MIAAPSPGLNYVEYGLVILFFAFIEYKFHIRNYLITNHRRFYAYFSYFGLIGVTIGVFGGLDYTGNILLIRALNAGNSGHLLSWIAIMLIAYRFGYNDIFKGVLVAGAFAAFHEIISVGITLVIGAYGASVGITLAEALWYYSTFFFLLAAILVAYFTFTGTETWYEMKRAVIFLTIYSIIVSSIGAIGTVDLSGPTIYFYNLDVNLIEQLSWLLPSVVLIGLGFRKKADVETGIVFT